MVLWEYNRGCIPAPATVTYKKEMKECNAMKFLFNFISNFSLEEKQKNATMHIFYENASFS